MPELKAFEKSIVEKIVHPRAQPGFAKPIRNGLRKVQNLIESRLSRAETGLTGRGNGNRFQKEE